MEEVRQRTASVFLLGACALLMLIWYGAPVVPHTTLASPSDTSVTSPFAPLLPGEGDTALNWAGYIASDATYTGVRASWTVPEVTDPDGNSADATWVGIGGAISEDLIQAGTEALPTYTGGMTYRAWMEALPGRTIPIPVAIAPGDQVSVSITHESGILWHISFRNETSDRSFETDVQYESSYSSAEWIEEMPTAAHFAIGLDDFGRVRFSNASAIVDGVQKSIADAAASPVRMTGGDGGNAATPTQLGDDGASFEILRGTADPMPLSCRLACE